MFERYRKQFAKTAVQHSLTPHSSYVSVHSRSQQATPAGLLSFHYAQSIAEKHCERLEHSVRWIDKESPEPPLTHHPVRGAPSSRASNQHGLALVLGCCLPSSCCAVRVATQGTEHHRAAFAPTLVGWLFSYPSRQKHCSAFPFWLSYLQLQLVSFSVL
jgi:hypothetical protein